MLAWFKGKSFEEQVAEFDGKINQIVTSLVKVNEENIDEGEYDLTNLQNPEICNEYAIFLASELEKRFKKVDVAAISEAIYVGKRRKNSQKRFENNMNSNNYKSSTNEESKYTKKDLCLRIASHYVRILNIISAILTAINPKRNMCSRRIEALYKVTEEDVESGFIRTCDSDDTDRTNPLYTNNILNIPGIQQLLNLYYFHLAQDGDVSDAENLDNVRTEFLKMVDTFYNVFNIELGEQNVDELGKIESSINQSLQQINQVVNTSIAPIGQEASATPPPVITPDVYQQINGLTNLLVQLKQQIEEQKSLNKNTITPDVLTQIKKDLSNTVRQELTNVSSNFDSQMKEIKSQVDSLSKKVEVSSNSTTRKMDVKGVTTGETNINNLDELNENTNEDITEFAESGEESASNRQKNSKSLSRKNKNSEGEGERERKNNREYFNNENLGDLDELNSENKEVIGPVLRDTRQQGGQTNNTISSRNTSNNEASQPTISNSSVITTNITNTTTPTTMINNTQATPMINNTQPIQPTVTIDSAETAVVKFLQFFEKYNKEYNVPEELRIHMATKKAGDMVAYYECSSSPSKTKISIDESRFKMFKGIYQDLKQHYLDYSNNFLSIIEDQLLDKIEKTDEVTGEALVIYKLKSITNQSLNNIQLQVMKELTEYYTQCQQYYEDGFKALSESLVPDVTY
jgi:hypothetical protein